MKKLLKERENFIVVAIFLLTVLVAVNQLISRYCINGHDLEYHLLRIEALKENILIGRPFLKVNPLFFGGAGYASSMFYSDFLLYIPAVLRAVGVSIGASYHIFVAICVILCFGSAYYCVLKMTESKYAGLIAGILITLCPYHMDDVMVRAATGEYMAFIFVPFVLYGIFNVLYEEMDKPWILAVGFAGVLLSHTATFVMCLIFGIAAFLVKIKVFIKFPKIFLKAAITAGVTALATSFLWLPMFEQFMSASFSVTSGDGIDMLDAAVNLSQVLSQQFPTVGIMLILLAVPRIFLIKEQDRLVEYADWMILGAAIFAIMATNLLPWNHLARILSFVQFPWRFFLMSSVLLAISDAIIIKSFVERISGDEKLLNRSNTLWELTLLLIFIVMSGLSLTHQSENAQGYYDYSNDYYSYKPYTTNVIGGEWLPSTVYDRESLLKQSEEMITDDGTKLDFVRVKGKVISELDNEYKYVDVPLIYYKGYKAILIGSDNKKSEITLTGDGNNGLCRVYTNGLCGELIVNYSGTVIQKISYILSLIAIIGAVYYQVCENKKKNKPV